MRIEQIESHSTRIIFVPVEKGLDSVLDPPMETVCFAFGGHLPVLGEVPKAAFELRNSVM